MFHTLHINVSKIIKLAAFNDQFKWKIILFNFVHLLLAQDPLIIYFICFGDWFRDLHQPLFVYVGMCVPLLSVCVYLCGQVRLSNDQQVKPCKLLQINVVNIVGLLVCLFVCFPQRVDWRTLSPVLIHSGRGSWSTRYLINFQFDISLLC